MNAASRRTVLLVTDSSHSIIGEIADGKTNPIAYSAYGQQSAQQEVATRLGFNGQLREMQSSWYLLGNGYRAYNPRLMRFHSPDSWSPFGGGGLNAYMYCMGDPVNRADPTGHINFFKHIQSPNKRTGSVPRIGMREGAEAMRALQQNRTYEKTSDLKGFLGAGGMIFKPKPKVDWVGRYPPKGDRSTDGMEWGTTPPFVPSRPTQTSTRPVAHQASSTTGRRPSYSEPPPSYKQAMKLWNANTFAASYKPPPYVVNRMVVDRMDNLGAAAPYQAPAGAGAGAAPPPPPVVVEHNQLLQGLAELNNMQRETIQHRANTIRCQIL